MADEDRGHLDYVKTLPCRVPGCARWPCDPNHTGPRAAGRRSHDHLAIPLCREHHADWTAHSGFFKGWDREERYAWAMLQVAEVLGRRARELQNEIEAA